MSLPFWVVTSFVICSLLKARCLRVLGAFPPESCLEVMMVIVVKRAWVTWGVWVCVGICFRCQTHFDMVGGKF